RRLDLALAVRQGGRRSRGRRRGEGGERSHQEGGDRQAPHPRPLSHPLPPPGRGAPPPSQTLDFPLSRTVGGGERGGRGVGGPAQNRHVAFPYMPRSTSSREGVAGPNSACRGESRFWPTRASSRWRAAFHPTCRSRVRYEGTAGEGRGST